MEDWVGVDFRGVVLILGSGFSRFCCAVCLSVCGHKPCWSKGFNEIAL